MISNLATHLTNDNKYKSLILCVAFYIYSKEFKGAKNSNDTKNIKIINHFNYINSYWKYCIWNL